MSQFNLKPIDMTLQWRVALKKNEIITDIKGVGLINICRPGLECKYSSGGGCSSLVFT